MFVHFIICFEGMLFGHANTSLVNSVESFDSHSVVDYRDMSAVNWGGVPHADSANSSRIGFPFCCVLHSYVFSVYIFCQVVMLRIAIGPGGTIGLPMPFAIVRMAKAQKC